MVPGVFVNAFSHLEYNQDANRTKRSYNSYKRYQAVAGKQIAEIKKGDVESDQPHCYCQQCIDEYFHFYQCKGELPVI